MKTALLLLENQNDYFPNGRHPLKRSLDAAQKAHELLEAFRKINSSIVHVQQISTQPNASYFLPCTKGAEFYAITQPIKGETIIKKHYPNSFKDTPLLNYLIKNQINHLVICGMMTHMAVDATVRAAYDLGFMCTVIHDACAGHQLEFNHTIITAEDVHTAFLAALQPTYADVISTSQLLQRMGSEKRTSDVT